MASGGSFKITVSAIDNTTSVLKKINVGFAKQHKMFSGINVASKNFGLELKKLGKLSGFNDLSKSIKTFSSGITTAVGTVGKFVTGIAAIAGAASVAGIAKLATDLAYFNRTLENSARNMGVTPQALEKVQKAASLLGIDANTTTGALQSLGTTMQDALNGRNNEAALMFRSLGINIQDVGVYAKDPISILPKLADAISKIPDEAGRASAKMRVASALFGGYAAAMMPLLDKGSAGYDKLISQVTKYTNYNKASALITEKMNQSLALTNMAADSLGKSIGGALAPVITRLSEAVRPILDKMNAWVQANRELIDTKVTEYLDKVSNAISVAWNWIDWIVEGTIGWKAALIGIGAIMAASFAVPILSFIIAPLNIVIQTLSLVGKAMLLLAMNPAILAVVAAVALLGLAVYEIYEHWDARQEISKEDWEGRQNKGHPLSCNYL